MQGNNVLVPPRPYWASLYFWLVAALLGTLVATAGPMAPAERASPSIPPTFMANAGQFDPEVQFYLRDGSMGLVIERGQLTLKSTTLSEGSLASGTVHIDFIDSNPEVDVRGTGDPQGVVNFYLGSDPNQWVDGVPTYAAVTQHELYPGISHVFLQSDGHLKSEFHVAPGANPAKIRMQYSGAESLRLAANGDLVITTDIGTWRESAPEVFQLIGAERRVIPSSFQVSEADVVSFELGAFDSEYPLVIDPTLYFSTFLGGTDGDSGGDIVIDGDGNVLVMGGTESTDFPLVNEVASTNLGNGDFFVSKLGPTGSNLLYSTYFGGSNRELSADIDVDSDGNAYCVGWTLSGDLPITSGVFQPTFAGGGDDAVVFKLDPAGALIYSTYLGGTGDDQPEDIVVDGAGQAFIVGNTNSSAFPTTTGAYSETVSGVWDFFVTKLDAGANNLVYSTFIGGVGFDEPLALDIDFDGNAYVVGRTQSPDYPIMGVAGGSVYDSVYDGTDTAVLTKLNAAGDDLVYSTFLDGISPRFGSRQLDVKVDSSRFAYVMAPTEGSSFTATTGAFDEVYNGGIDMMLMKVEPDASGLVYSTFLGGTGDDRAHRIEVDSSGSVHVTGSTTSTDFPTADAISTGLNGAVDIFVARLSADGSSVPFSTYLGGSETDSANGIDLAPRGPCVTGFTTSTDYPTLAPLPFVPFQANFGGGANDAVVTCLDAPGPSEGCLKPPSGMAYWAPFDEEFGTTTADLVAGNNGTHMGSAAPTGGIVAGAIDLDGGYVEVPHSSDLDLGVGDFTIDFWIRRPGIPVGGIVSKFDSSSNLGVEVLWDIQTSIPSVYRLSININGVFHTLPLAVPEGGSLPWTHVVIVVDRDDSEIFSYINGSFQGSTPLGVPPGVSVNNSEPLLIGKGVAFSADFSGQLDELEIFRRALAAVEAQELYAAGSDGKCKDRLHVGWDAKICEDPDYAVVTVEVCNYGTTPQDYELTFGPLPTGPGCSVAGPIVFEHAVTGALPPLAVMVPGQSCVPVPVKIQRPAGMTSHNQTGCYEVIRRNVATGGTRITAGSVQDKRFLCPIPLPGDLEPDFSRDVGGLPVDSVFELTFPMANRSATPLPVDYEIQASMAGEEGAPVAVRLDGGEVGEPVQGATVIPPLGNVDITVSVENAGLDPFEIPDVVVYTDTTGQGTLIPFDSAGLRVPLPTEAIVVNHDHDTTLQDTAVLVDVLSNDFGLTSPLDPSSVQVLSGPFHGTAMVNGSGDITYTPSMGFSGGDGMLYEVCVTGGACGTAVVRLAVTAKGDPIIFADGFETGDTSAWSDTVP